MFFFPVDLYKTEAVEPTVDCSQRAQVLTEGPVDFYGEQDNRQQNPQFPEKESASLSPQGFVSTGQRNRAEQCTRRAKIFAERRNFCISSKQNHGAKAYQNDQHKSLLMISSQVDLSLAPSVACSCAAPPIYDFFCLVKMQTSTRSVMIPLSRSG